MVFENKAYDRKRDASRSPSIISDGVPESAVERRGSFKRQKVGEQPGETLGAQASPVVSKQVRPALNRTEHEPLRDRENTNLSISSSSQVEQLHQLSEYVEKNSASWTGTGAQPDLKETMLGVTSSTSTEPESLAHGSQDLPESSLHDSSTGLISASLDFDFDFDMFLSQLDPVEAVASQICLPQVDSNSHVDQDRAVWRQLSSPLSTESISLIIEESPKLTPSTDSVTSQTGLIKNFSFDSGSSTSGSISSHSNQVPSSENPVLNLEMSSARLDQPNHYLQGRAMGSSVHRTESWRWVSRCFHASILAARNDSTQAMISMTDASTLFGSMITRRDPLLLTAPVLLLSVLLCQGQKELAKAFMTSALANAKLLLGEENKIFSALSWQLAWGAGTLSSCSIECEGLAEIQEHFEQDLGVDHPYTLTSLYMLGFNLIRYERYEEAERKLRDLLARSERVLGAYHVQTVAALTALARVLGYLKQEDLSELKWLDALERSQKLLGNDHPQRIEIRRRLGAHYEAVGKPEQAKNVYMEVLYGRVRMLGVQHPFTQGSLEDLTKFLESQGWSEEASRIRSEIDADPESENFSVPKPGAY